jgi:hypothetical protein
MHETSSRLVRGREITNVWKAVSVKGKAQGFNTEVSKFQSFKVSKLQGHWLGGARPAGIPSQETVKPRKP